MKYQFYGVRLCQAFIGVLAYYYSDFYYETCQRISLESLRFHGAIQSYPWTWHLCPWITIYIASIQVFKTFNKILR